MIRLWTRRGALALLALGLAACAKPGARNAPTASAVTPNEVEQMKRAVAPLVDRSPETQEMIQTAKGAHSHVLSGNRQVLITRRNQDGSFSTACVDSVEGAEQALTTTAPNTHLEAR
jgi:hypothetical protein